MNQKISKGIIIVLWANIINMFISLITNFVLPRHLSFESYATIKAYQLYVSYIGLFHLGFPDGLYLKYGGRTLNNLNKNDVGISISTMTMFQTLVTILVLIYSIIKKDCLLTIFSLDIIGFNMMGLFKSIYQAVGEFKRYANATQAVALINFIINMTLIMIIKTDNPYIYILGYACVDFFVFLYLDYTFRKNIKLHRNKIKFSWSDLIENITNGFLLLLGNLTSIILVSMDRWFTKILLQAVDFAQYSFAVSVETMLNVVISPISITLYNYLCNNCEWSHIKRIQKKILIFSACVLSAFFPVKLILHSYLKKYLLSQTVIILLFASQFFSILIQCVYVNIYKAQKRQKRYFIQVISVILIGFVLNIVFFKVMENKESFALGTLLSTFIWFMICQTDYKELRLCMKEMSFLILQLILFFYSAFIPRALVGFIMYAVGTIILCIFFMYDESLDIIRIFKEIIGVRNR